MDLYGSWNTPSVCYTSGDMQSSAASEDAHLEGQGNWVHVGQILICDLASGEPEVTSALTFWIFLTSAFVFFHVFVLWFC